jgi:hypothetical protein
MLLPRGHPLPRRLFSHVFLKVGPTPVLSEDVSWNVPDGINRIDSVID